MTSSDTPRPKPAPPKPKPTAEAPVKAANTPKAEKPKFVRKPHLTERPFKAHEGLLELQKQLEKKSPSQARSNKGKK